MGQSPRACPGGAHHTPSLRQSCLRTCLHEAVFLPSTAGTRDLHGKFQTHGRCECSQPWSWSHLAPTSRLSRPHVPARAPTGPPGPASEPLRRAFRRRCPCPQILARLRVLEVSGETSGVNSAPPMAPGAHPHLSAVWGLPLFLSPPPTLSHPRDRNTVSFSVAAPGDTPFRPVTEPPPGDPGHQPHRGSAPPAAGSPQPHRRGSSVRPSAVWACTPCPDKWGARGEGT